MARKKKTETKRPIAPYEHRDKARVNNPPVGLVTPETDPDTGQQKKRYAYDPHLDPQLVWAGKAEHTSFEVPTVSLHVHERIDPRTIIEAVRKKNGQQEPVQLGLFEVERQEPLHKVVEFYQHKHDWSNRLIAGDSLLVMNSLLEKEGMAGKVQMIYIDPPYGIRYGSNFQPFVNKRDVKDGKDEDLTSEPEQIRAFRDTWELGIHSYLTYLRDRLLLARELLTESGSIFVQISDENVHHVRELMDEVFGAGNFVSQISFRTKIPLRTTLIANVHDYLLWYARSKGRLKFRKLYTDKGIGDEGRFSLLQMPDGSRRYMTREEKGGQASIPNGARPYVAENLNSAGRTESCVFDFAYEGRVFRPTRGKSWKTNLEGMKSLVTANRLFPIGNNLYYVLFHEDYPVQEIPNVWNDTRGEIDKTYAVQTTTTVIQRCLLMTTDPGDLVFDPTCGSGTTAYVAEQWGRRWITCDTSRVALTLARQRLMTAVFDYYELAHPEEGVGSGFKYKTVPHVTLKSIANNPEIDGIYARMHPAIEQALADLNAALRLPSPPGRWAGGEGYPRFKVTQGGRAGQFVDFAAPDSATFTMPAGQAVKVNELVEWEVPFEFPADWPEAARKPFDAFHAARRAMQKAMDKAIARHASQETLYDQPFVDRKKVRVTGPFTVEAVPAPAVKSPEEIAVKSPEEILEARSQPADTSIARSGETLRQAEWRDELLRAGIRGKAGQYIRFARLEPLPGCRFLHADGETRPSDEGADSVRETGPADSPMRVVVSFGSEHAPLEQRQVAQAIEEAHTLVPRPKLIVFAAFQFDPEAAKDIDETHWPGVTLLKVQMNADLLTDDLKKKRASNDSFWLIGQPDVEVRKEKDGKYVVAVHGFDYYNTKTGGVESGGADKIAVWMLDTDYDGRSLYPRQVFFPMAGEGEGWAKLARNLKAEIDEELIEAYRGTVSLPFEPGEHKRIAVKIVDDRGIESLKIMEIDT
ncbi:site-specific DNA-methyltransferase [Thermosynechococcus sp. PP45]|uniref:site-specific DNA-methyltransferase n=1 Tax=unclassified Thermosynechococcus TaxID=2622553 RepID=UPI002673C0E0|nr:MULTISPECIES: site-specific DNA-methyltransferase [unclassified Thermosynechococcus]WKT81424.1 site-specific DNA-methyltransferase [Thermosynechococcus sp. PP45]WNC25035.1 site-specific DNA-methyltransferase [Thermosynechococcus sp. PP551]WNC27613.1 site-specific DNA-methyltransferase [Thermosynechococcus sp. PP555]